MKRIVEWFKQSYKKENQAGTIFPFSQMGTVTMNDGAKATIAWLPKPFVLVVDIPDRNASYHLGLRDVVEALEDQLTEEDKDEHLFTN